MKLKYEMPETKVKELEIGNVLTASGNGDILPDDNIVDGSDGW